MMAAVGASANPKREKESAGSTSSIIQQPESHNPLDSVYPADSEIEVLR